jgi:hypothetical protein
MFEIQSSHILPLTSVNLYELANFYIFLNWAMGYARISQSWHLEASGEETLGEQADGNLG